MSIEGGPSPEFLTEKYADLHKTPEVDKSVQKLRREGEKIPDKKESRIDAHFRRIDRALEGKRGFFTHLVKDKLTKDFTINLQKEDGTEDEGKVEKLANGLFESEKEVLRRRGMGAELEEYGDTISPEDYEKYRQQIYSQKAEQEKTLGVWIDYLGSEEANFYPTWFKYLALRSLQKMGKRDRDVQDYSKRSANTLTPFPDLSREALALTLDAIKKKEAGALIDTEKEYTEDEQEKIKELETVIGHGDFAKLYAHFQNEVEEARREAKVGTAGEWRYFPKGSDPQVLKKTLEGKGTEWCTAGGDVCASQLRMGEFWVYYTYDQDKKPANPRVAIYLINGEISEVRGVYGKDQDLELDFVDIAREKYQEFPGSEKYEKKDHDMKYLSKIEDKIQAGFVLTKDDLIFLYEMDSKIEGFGHGADPRVAELRKTRNPKEDAPTVFDCRPEEIAWSEQEIGPQTKAYVGPLFKGIFDRLAHLEYIYTAFPEARIRRSELEIGGKTAQELERELEQKNFKIYDYARDMLRSKDFTTLRNPETIDLVRLKVRDLGFTSGATTEQIYTRALELGLELCPAEVGPHQRLKDTDQQLGDWHLIAMKQIADRIGIPSVFRLSHRADGLWLDHDWAYPDYSWYPDDELMFRLRK